MDPHINYHNLTGTLSIKLDDGAPVVLKGAVARAAGAVMVARDVDAVDAAIERLAVECHERSAAYDRQGMVSRGSAWGNAACELADIAPWEVGSAEARRLALAEIVVLASYRRSGWA